MKFHGIIKYSLFALATLVGLTACRIDEDLSDCGRDYRLDYRVKLQTNVSTAISAELTTHEETALGTRLMEVLADFFAEYAHDVDLSFFELLPPQGLRHHESHILAGNSASYTLYMPAENYRHLSIANVDGEPMVNHQPDAMTTKLYSLRQVDADTVDSHRIGLFTARKDMEVSGDVDQLFDVSLYMANAAMALVIYPNGNVPEKVEMYLHDLATEFSINDSTYIYNESPVVRTHNLPDTGSDLICCYGMGFPSKSVAASNAPHRSSTDETLWRLVVNVTMSDGNITRTVMEMPTPLRAGSLEIIKVHLQPNGELVPNRSEIGTSVELDWSQGGEYNPTV